MCAGNARRTGRVQRSDVVGLIDHEHVETARRGRLARGWKRFPEEAKRPLAFEEGRWR